MAQKQIQYYGQFQPTGVDTSGAQRLQTLAKLGEQVGALTEKIVAPKLQERGYERGLKEGAKAAETGEAIKPRDSIFPNYFDDAYNKGMKSSYVAGVQASFRENAAKIAAESGPDLEMFSTRMNAYKAGAMKNVSPEMKPYFESTANEVIATYRTQVGVQQASLNRRNASEVMSESVTTFTNDMLRFTKMGDLVQAEAARGEAFLALDLMVDSQFITSSAAEVAKRTLFTQHQTEVARTQLSNLLTLPNGIVAAADFVQNVEASTLEGKTKGEMRLLPVEDQRKIVDLLRSDMSQYIALENAKEAESKRVLAKNQEINTVNLMTGILTGEAGLSEVMAAAGQKGISATQYSQLQSMINTRGQGVDDHMLIYQINDAMQNNPVMARQMIFENVNRKVTGDTALTLLKALDELEKPESVLNTQVVKDMRQRIKDYNVVPGIGGQFDQDELRRNSDLQMVFNARVLAGENPVLVAEEMINAGDLIKEGISNRSDFDAKMKDLAQKMRLAKSGDKRHAKFLTSYQNQLQELRKLEQKLATIELFNKDLERARKGQL